MHPGMVQHAGAPVGSAVFVLHGGSFAHTHDRKRYFFRIWCIGAGMAAVQFFMIYAKRSAAGMAFTRRTRSSRILFCSV